MSSQDDGEEYALRGWEFIEPRGCRIPSDEVYALRCEECGERACDHR